MLTRRDGIQKPTTRTAKPSRANRSTNASAGTSPSPQCPQDKWWQCQGLFSNVLGWIEPTAANYVAGLIILAAVPCTAMVFVWSYLNDGERHLHARPGRHQRPHHCLRLRADRHGAVRRERGPHPGPSPHHLRCRLHRGPTGRRLAQPCDLHQSRGPCVVQGNLPPQIPPGRHPRLAGHAHSHLRVSSREHPYQLGGRLAASRANPHSGLFQQRAIHRWSSEACLGLLTSSLVKHSFTL